MSDRTGSGTASTKGGARTRPAWRDVHGIVVVDKPVGLTSNAVLQKVRRAYRARKAGHTGSLDPLASGVLPLCFGEATKLSGLLLDAAKTYEVVGRLGARTATGDLDGEVVAEAPVPSLDEEALDKVLDRFRGEIEQVPPMYSALKHEGRRLYELARRGQTVERPPRRVTIERLELLDWRPPEIRLRVRCSKGTYIRTLIEDIGTTLESAAHVVELRRVGAGPFVIEDATPLALLVDPDASADFLAGRLLPADAGIPELPAVCLEPSAADRLRHGQSVTAPTPGRTLAAGTVRVYGPRDRFLGLGECDGRGVIAPRRLFNLPEGP